jgi:uncharacterized protein
MKINIKDIPLKGKTFQFQEYGEAMFTEMPPELVDFKLKGPLEISLSVEPVGPNFRVQGTLKGILMLNCSRCLVQYEMPLDTTWEAFLSPLSSLKGEEELELAQEDMEVTFFQEDLIDPNQLIRDQIFLSLPWKPLCSLSCPGLCPRCGKNLNEGSCVCKGALRESSFQN